MTRARSAGTGEGGDRAAELAPLVAIVDDDASVRQATDRLIRSFGYRTRMFASGEEFLDSGAASEAGCLLLDVRMSGMDGLEVQRRLAERGARIPIVFVTGRASDEEERRARSAGAAEFLRKPAGSASLRRAVDDVLHARDVARGDRNGE